MVQKTLIRHRNEHPVPIPKMEIKRHDPEVENEYNELSARRRELNAELAAHNREVDQILAGLGELVASGSKYKKQIDRLATLRQESEALSAGIRYIDGQVGLLKRSNNWLKTR